MSSTNTEDPAKEVPAFVAQFRRERLDRISPAATLFGDLGIDGDDAYELLVAYKERFHVDMSAYRHDRHFGPEGFVPWAPIYWSVLMWRAYREKGSTPESRARLRPITVQDLIDSAKAGRWSLVYDTKTA